MVLRKKSVESCPWYYSQSDLGQTLKAEALQYQWMPNHPYRLQQMRLLTTFVDPLIKGENEKKL